MTAEFDEFATGRWDRLVRAGVLLGAPLHEAEDLAQETLLRCYLHWSKVEKAENRELLDRGSGHTSIASARVPDPGPGMKWVGHGRAVVAVPVTWPALAEACPDPGERYVYEWAVAQSARCLPDTKREPVSVGVGSFRTAVHMDAGTDLKPEGRVQGLVVLSGGTVVFQMYPPVRITSFAVPDEDAFFSLKAVGTDGREELDRIRQSLTLLPDGYVIDHLDEITQAR